MYTDKTSSHPEHKLFKLQGITYVRDFKVKLSFELWDISEAWALRRARKTFGKYWVCTDIQEFKQYPKQDLKILKDNIKQGKETLKKDLRYIMLKKLLDELE